MKKFKENIFERIPDNIPDEIFESIIESNSIKIERIISKGHSSAENFWYDQDKNEWVIILKGNAAIEFEDKNIIELKEGDYLNISAHQKHRVKWIDPENETIWLAVFY